LGYDEDLSRTVSGLLRHKAHRSGIPIGEDGYARFSDLWRALDNRHSDEIMLVVELSTREDGLRPGPRFELISHEQHGQLIRARGKHTLKCVNRDLVRSGAPTTGPPQAVHSIPAPRRHGHHRQQSYTSHSDFPTPNPLPTPPLPSARPRSEAQPQEVQNLNARIQEIERKKA